MSLTTLDALKCGEEGIVLQLNLNSDLVQRFAAFGMKIGKTVRVLRRVGRSGPLHIRVDSIELILRPHEARFVELQLFP